MAVDLKLSYWRWQKAFVHRKLYNGSTPSAATPYFGSNVEIESLYTWVVYVRIPTESNAFGWCEGRVRTHGYHTKRRLHRTLNAIDAIEHSTRRITIIILLRLMQRFHPRNTMDLLLSYCRRLSVATNIYDITIKWNLSRIASHHIVIQFDAPTIIAGIRHFDENQTGIQLFSIVIAIAYSFLFGPKSA